MRALEYPGPGSAAAAPRTVEAAVPRAGPGQVLVRVEAAGLPPAAGAPAGIPGTEFAGVVVQLGPGTYGLEVGDEVLGHCPSGACAEYAAADADRVAHRPVAMPWAEAALLPVTAAGVVAALDRLAVRRGSTLLVHGAGSAAGRAAVALALRRGAAVVAVAPEREHAALREAGAVPVGHGVELAERARAAAPQGVDAVLDVLGPGSAPLWPALAGGPERVAVPTPAPGGRSVGGAESTELGELVELWEEGAFRLPPDTVLPLAEAAAYRAAGGGALAVVRPWA
ncbi:NADPH:quinone reductase-like Zn-dependent oxidoreductase [Streptomyces sp. TLI_235]|nr:alcohol dehydrogenase catalytic domain-containing protein [Streptomyces sp. TLI_235]PBC79697.1 NADPH:quinone reductase-like Zn-dependent oxidoreductase [Streptomyces sp. TLI_235]